LAEEGASLYVTVAVYWQEVWSRKLKCFFPVMEYSALFNNVFEAGKLTFTYSFILM
jgi:hypothetical protein